jgi:hypothetical protein
MKKLSKLIIAVIFLMFFSVSNAQNTTKTYKLTFPEYEIQDIKPLVSIVSPLFETNIEIKDDNYSIFYFTTTKNVAKEEVLEALKDSKYSLVSFTVE